ncbi:MAG: DUF3467 domain-containing protein [Sedimentisphaerales bacterium]|nr:DUF3467 domain-containing protein [Sedimentisphaerales bacterium]
MPDDKNKAENEGKVTEKPAPAGEGGEGRQIRITLDDSEVNAAYTNFCRVTGSPEELIIDFALNPNPFSREDQTVKVSQRLVLNYFTAKRLFAALQQTIMRHEQNFGVIELNVQRRLTAGAPAAGGSK